MLASGRLRWSLLPPPFAMYSSWHPSSSAAVLNATAHAAAVARHGGTTRGRHLQPLRCLQTAGDVLFVPDGWAAAYIADVATVGVRGAIGAERLEFAP